MKTVILAGGLGTRLSEETSLRPKPMVEIGDRPILEHILEIYSSQGFNEFIIALGYKGSVVKEHFLSLYEKRQNLTVDLHNGKIDVHADEHVGKQPDWKLHLIDTGHDSQTGGRVGRLRAWLQDGTFMLTYGDGVADIDIQKLVEFHRSHGKLATMTTVRPPARFGGVEFDGDRITRFTEKPQIGEGWINGGFFVLEPAVLDLISDDSTIWERYPLEKLAEDGQLMAYRHEGFWQAMDTLREKRILESMWASGNAPWVRNA